MIVRKANYDDVKILNQFLTLLIQDERQYDTSIDENFVVTNMYENYIEDARRLILVAEEDENIVGYLYGYLQVEYEVDAYKIAKLDALYVDCNYRHYGIATSLIEYFKKWAISKNAHKIEVNVWSNNVKAKNLYEKVNFKTTSEILTMDL